MHFSRLRLQNFRGIDDLSVEFLPGCNVLAGINGIGKSAILDAMSIMMGGLVLAFDSKAKIRNLSAEDIKNDAETCSLEISLRAGSIDKTWSLNASRKHPGRRPKAIKWETSLPFAPAALGGSPPMDSTAPMLILYSSYRAVIRIPERVRAADQRTSRFHQGYAQQEDGASDFRQFFVWFRGQEDVENERRIEDSNHRDASMEAVREAVRRFTGFEKLRIRRQTPMRMTLEKLGMELSVNQLSDGEKTMLAMVGDIARRLSLLNPGPKAEDVLSGIGVVLIDEVELHLHPRWQREILAKLQSTFPNCQFVVTTHSPQVLSHVEAERVWLLDRGEDGRIRAQHPEWSLGLDSNRILLELFDVPERPQEAKDEIDEVFRLLGQGEIVSAKERIAETKAKVGNLPELDAASALIRRKEHLGR